jgi:hypothetical protein
METGRRFLDRGCRGGSWAVCTLMRFPLDGDTGVGWQNAFVSTNLGVGPSDSSLRRSRRLRRVTGIECCAKPIHHDLAAIR